MWHASTCGALPFVLLLHLAAGNDDVATNSSASTGQASSTPGLLRKEAPGGTHHQPQQSEVQDHTLSGSVLEQRAIAIGGQGPGNANITHDDMTQWLYENEDDIYRDDHHWLEDLYVFLVEHQYEPGFDCVHWEYELEHWLDEHHSLVHDDYEWLVEEIDHWFLQHCHGGHHDHHHHLYGYYHDHGHEHEHHDYEHEHHDGGHHDEHHHEGEDHAWDEILDIAHEEGGLHEEHVEDQGKGFPDCFSCWFCNPPPSNDQNHDGFAYRCMCLETQRWDKYKAVNSTLEVNPFCSGTGSTSSCVWRAEGEFAVSECLDFGESKCRCDAEYQLQEWWERKAEER